MNSYLIYRASFYLMLTVATMALSGDTIEKGIAHLYPMAVAVAGLVAFLTVDRHSRWAMARPIANLLAVLTLVVLYFEYKLDDTQLIRALGHWLVYLQVIKYFLPKSPEDDWILFLLGLMEVLIGAVVSQHEGLGIWLFAWAMLAIWVLGQFFLQREAGRFQQAGGMTSRQVPRPGEVDPYDGLFDLPYLVATARVLITTLALGGLIFLTLPRQSGATRSQPGAPMTRHLTGFDEEVALGQFGEILENDSVVMTVDFADADGKAVDPPIEPLWRGVTMLLYEKGRWRRQTKSFSQMYVGFPERGRPRKLIRQRIKLEANDSTTLFGIRPVWDAAARLGSPYLNPIDGTLLRQDSRGGPYDYEVTSDPVPAGIQPGEELPSFSRTEMLLSIESEALKARLHKIAEPVIASIPDQDPGLSAQPAQEMSPEERKAQQEWTVARARALESFLRDSGLFAYSLHMEVVDASLDPVEDFLINRKEGHCEYFASALALLLRSIGIKARLVNGFKGGDWNDLTQTMNVRQKHAHSWVEAYVGEGPDDSPNWITLDPTPATAREESIAHVGGIAGNFRPMTDLIRHIWVFFIVGYDRDRQDRLLYAPMRQMIGWMRENYNKLLAVTKGGFAILFSFQDLSAFISWRGGIVTFLAGLLLIGMVQLAYRLGRLILRWFHGPAVDSTSLTAGILFYRRLAQLLAQLELERTPAETQGEFAVRAGKFLTGQGLPAQSVAEVPREVVDAFYRVRFGHLELPSASLAELDARLDALEASLDHPH